MDQVAMIRHFSKTGIICKKIEIDAKKSKAIDNKIDMYRHVHNPNFAD
jgi:hypothetical protein